MSFSKLKSCKTTQAQFNILPELRVDILTPIITEVRRTFPDSDVVVDKLISVASIGFLAFRHLNDPLSVAASCTGMVGVLGLSAATGKLFLSLFTRLQNFISSMHRYARQTNAQADDEHDDLMRHFRAYDIVGVMSYLGGIGFATLVALILGRLPGKGTIDEMMMRIKHLPGTVKSASDIQEFGSKMCSSLIQGVKKYCFGYTDEQYDLFNGVKEWQDEVAFLISQESVMRIKHDAAMQARADAVYQRGLAIAAEYDSLRYPYAKQEAFRTYMIAAARIRDMAHNSGAGHMKPRPEPIVVQLYGGTGVGKSVITNAIAADFLRARGFRKESDLHNLVYYRKVGQEFWDGFTSNHKIVCFDDWGQVKDVAGAPNSEFIEIIHAGNNAPYPVHMADLVSKANTFFNAEVMLLTSNLPWFDIPSLTFPEALKRRMHLRARMYPADEFACEVMVGGVAEKRIDPIKCLDRHFTEIYRFDIVAPNESANPPTAFSQLGLTYTEFVKLVLDLDTKMIAKNKSVLTEIGAYISRPDDELTIPATVAHMDNGGEELDLEIPVVVDPLDEDDVPPPIILEVAQENADPIQIAMNARNWQDLQDAREAALAQAQRDLLNEPAFRLHRRPEEPLVHQALLNDVPPPPIRYEQVTPMNVYRAMQNELFVQTAAQVAEHRTQRSFAAYTANVSEAAVMALHGTARLAKASKRNPFARFFLTFMMYMIAPVQAFNWFKHLFGGHATTDTLHSHVDMSEFVDLPVPHVNTRMLPLVPPQFYHTIAALKGVNCFAAHKDEVFHFSYAHHVASYVARINAQNDDPTEAFVKTFYSLIPEVKRLTLRQTIPIPCAQRCRTKLGQMLENLKYTVITNPFNDFLGRTTEAGARSLEHMSPSRMAIMKMLVGAISLFLTVFLTLCWVNTIRWVIDVVKTFFSTSLATSDVLTTSTSAEGIYPDGRGTVAPRQVIVEGRVYELKPGNAPVRTMVESKPLKSKTVVAEGLFSRIASKIVGTKVPQRPDVSPATLMISDMKFFMRMSKDRKDSAAALTYLLANMAKYQPDFGKYIFFDEEKKVYLVKHTVLDAGLPSIQIDETDAESRWSVADDFCTYVQSKFRHQQEVVVSPAEVPVMAAAAEQTHTVSGPINRFKNPFLTQSEFVRTLKAQASETTAHACLDTNAVSLYGKILYQNMYKLEVQNLKGDWRHLMNLTFLFGRVAVINRHALYSLRNREFIRLRSPSCRDGVIVAVVDLKFAIYDDNKSIYAFRDVALLSFPRSIRQHPDLRKHLMTAEDFSRFTDLKKAALVGMEPTNNIDSRIYVTKDVRSSDRLLDMAVSLGEPAKTVLIRDHFEYNLETVPGECGMILISMNPQHLRKIVGFHCSGQPDPDYQGNATPLSLEMVDGLSFVLLNEGVTYDTLISNSEFENCDEVIAQCVAIENEKGYEMYRITVKTNGDHFSPLGYVKDPVFSGSHSSIKPSPIGEYICTNSRAPARLTPFRNEEGDLIDPMKLAMKKADVAPTYVNAEILEACVEDVLSMYSADRSRDMRPLTLEQSIRGIPGDPYVQSLNRKSSPGYPWIHQRTSGRGKEQWLGTAEEFNFTDRDFLRAYHKRMQAAAKGIRIPTLWIDTLKDELRPIPRVLAGKTRLFSVGEMTFNIAVRRYFLPVVAHLMQHRIDYEICVGVNPYSVDWERIAKRMLSKGCNIIAGDFSNFDGSLLGDFLWAAFDILCALSEASEQEKQIMFVLYSDIAHSNHLNGNTIYGWNHSQPSGNPLTVVINSVINSLIVRYAWMVVMKDTEFYGMKAFHTHCATVNFGDDNLINISSEVIERFNMMTITDAFATFGFTYTDEHKSLEVLRARSLKEVSFLKRGFTFDHDLFRWKAPLVEESVLEMAQWVRGKEDPQSTCAQTLEMAVYELAQYRKMEFMKHMPTFKSAAALLCGSYRPRYETYDTYQRMDGQKYFLMPNFG